MSNLFEEIIICTCAATPSALEARRVRSASWNGPAGSLSAARNYFNCARGVVKNCTLESIFGDVDFSNPPIPSGESLYGYYNKPP